jgi:hypothetical protein
MTSNSTKLPVLGSDGEIAVDLLDGWFDPIEAGLRDRVRDFIQTMIESELRRCCHDRLCSPAQCGSFALAPASDPPH